MAVQVAATSPVAAGQNAATPIGTNLLVNPGAEAGDPSADGYSAVTIPGWTVTGTPTVVQYGTQRRFPAPAPAPGPALPDFGQQFFSLGLADSSIGLADSHQRCGSISQGVPLTGHAAAIDAQHMELSWSVQLATRGHQIDRARAVLLIYDLDGKLLRHVLLSSATATNEHYRLSSRSVTLPAGARSVTVKLWESSSEQQGKSCDAFYDNLSLKLFYMR